MLFPCQDVPSRRHTLQVRIIESSAISLLPNLAQNAPILSLIVVDKQSIISAFLKPLFAPQFVYFHRLPQLLTTIMRPPRQLFCETK
jgi:hypothetical protein